jgi:hypothetical protein
LHWLGLFLMSIQMNECPGLLPLVMLLMLAKD